MRLSTMLINGALSICAAATFVGCGSSSGTTTATGTKVGYFVDAPVEGLTYSCGGRTGTTGSDGGFRYNDGETCTFTVGGITVGSVAVPADGTVTPQDIAGVSRSDTSNGTVTKIAQFLQSLSDSSGNIKISAETAQKLANTSGSVASIDVATVASTVGKTVVDMGVAQSRLASYMNTLAASNPSFLTSGAANTPATTTTTTTTSSSDTTSTPVTYTVPVISSFPATITPTAQVASFTAQSDVSATGYWVVLPAADAAPTAAQILAGKDSTNSAVTLSGSATMSGGTAKLFSITGLAYATDYKVYFAAKNAGDATKVTAVSTATMSTAALADVTPTLSSLSAVGNAYNSATFSIKSDVGATGYWIAVPKATTMTGLTAAQVIAGKDKDDNDVALKGNVAMTGGATTEVTVTSLAVNTEYDIYFAVKNSAAATKTTLYGSPIQANTTVAPTISATSVDTINPAAGTATLKFTLNLDSNYYFVIQPSSNADAPTATQVTDGKDSTGEATTTGMSGNTLVAAGAGAQSENLSSISLKAFNAGFDVYLVAKNSTDATKVSSVVKISFTTPSATVADFGDGNSYTDADVDQPAINSTPKFRSPEAITVDNSGNVILIEWANTARKIASGGTVSMIASSIDTNGATADGTSYTGYLADFHNITGIAYAGATGKICYGKDIAGTSHTLYCKAGLTDMTGGVDVTTIGAFSSVTFGNVSYIASSGNDIVYVADGTTIHMLKLTSGSEAYASVNMSGNINGETVQGIAVASDGTTVYISTSANKIYKYDLSSLSGTSQSVTPTVLSTGSEHVESMAIVNGDIYFPFVNGTNIGIKAFSEGRLASGALSPVLVAQTTHSSVSTGKGAIAYHSNIFYITNGTGNKVVKITLP